MNPDLLLRERDPDLAEAVAGEEARQRDQILLIASENVVSPLVRHLTASVFTNKYAEGYPGARWYGGCEFVDRVESLAIERAKSLFGAGHANVQPHSGSQANMAVYFARLKPGDTVLAMNLAHGGHLTHGSPVNFSGRLYKIVPYGVDPATERIDYDALAALAERERPKMIVCGASSYPRTLDFERFGAIARSVGADLLADIAHVAGLVAAGVHPSPVPHASFVTMTTHKTLRGPRGGLVLTRAEHAKEVDSQLFPGIQGGPLVHVIAAKAHCFREAATEGFRRLQQQTVRNAAALAQALADLGYRIVAGGTDTHLFLVDLRPAGLTGGEVQVACEKAGIVLNKNAIPNDTRGPRDPSGVRIGTPAMTSRGMGEREMGEVAALVHEAIRDRSDPRALAKVREGARTLARRFPPDS
ncbi:MAG: serine hydroxymethyltransferase [Planctomycetales bacterium]|nr:serine hydroxymethyltransferase [Planctomycetales bacterium]